MLNEIVTVIIMGLLLIVVTQHYSLKYHRHWHEYFKQKRDEQDVYIKQLEEEIYDNLPPKE